MSTTVLLSPEVDREAWLAARRQGIGASEIAAVMGISPWESPFSLYWRKVNGWDYEPSAEMEWGTRLEDAIAAKYEANHPEYYVHPYGLMAHSRQRWMLATPDRLLCDHQMHDNPFPDDPTFGWEHATDELTMGVLELKTAHNADGWGEPGTAEIPVNYRAQVQWQMAVVDVEWVDVAVLIGGSDYREYTVARDERDIAVMVEHGRRFMERIATNDPPDLDEHAATLATVKRLHPSLDDTQVEVPVDVATGYRRACEMERKAKAVKARYEARLRAEMGSARKATHQGAFVASRSIYEVAEHVVQAHTVDRLNPPRGRKP